MVPDLEHVDGRQEATLEQHGLDGGLRVAGQQCGECAVAKEHHHRAVVDIAFRQGRCRVDVGRVQDLDPGRLVERELLAGTRQHHRRGRPKGGIGQQAVGSWILEGDAGVDQRTHPEAPERVDQTGHMILVRMAQDQKVDAAREERQIGTQPAEGQLGIRAAVDEHRRPCGRLDQDRVALPDVEHGQVQVAVGP